MSQPGSGSGSRSEQRRRSRSLGRRVGYSCGVGRRCRCRVRGLAGPGTAGVADRGGFFQICRAVGGGLRSRRRSRQLRPAVVADGGRLREVRVAGVVGAGECFGEICGAGFRVRRADAGLRANGRRGRHAGRGFSLRRRTRCDPRRGCPGGQVGGLGRDGSALGFRVGQGVVQGDLVVEDVGEGLARFLAGRGVEAAVEDEPGCGADAGEHGVPELRHVVEGERWGAGAAEDQEEEVRVGGDGLDRAMVTGGQWVVVGVAQPHARGHRLGDGVRAGRTGAGRCGELPVRFGVALRHRLGVAARPEPQPGGAVVTRYEQAAGDGRDEVAVGGEHLAFEPFGEEAAGGADVVAGAPAEDQARAAVPGDDSSRATPSHSVARASAGKSTTTRVWSGSSAMPEANAAARSSYLPLGWMSRTSPTGVERRRSRAIGFSPSRRRRG